MLEDAANLLVPRRLGRVGLAGPDPIGDDDDEVVVVVSGPQVHLDPDLVLLRQRRRELEYGSVRELRGHEHDPATRDDARVGHVEPPARMCANARIDEWVQKALLKYHKYSFMSIFGWVTGCVSGKQYNSNNKY